MVDEFKAAANKKAREEKKKAYLEGMLGRYSDEFRTLGDQQAASVARRVHGTMDAVLERERRKSPLSDDIQCRKGCNFCCRGPVEIWPQEAALLVEIAREHGVNIDPARLERQSRYNMENWREQPAADKACVFLGEDGACQVYEFRPNSCRKLLVVTEPALCDAEKHAAQSVDRWFSWEAEMLALAALEVFSAALMPRSLLAALRAASAEPFPAAGRAAVTKTSP